MGGVESRPSVDGLAALKHGVLPRWNRLEIGGGFDDSVLGDYTITAPSGGMSTRSPTCSANLVRIELRPQEGSSNVLPGGDIFVPSPSITGKKSKIKPPPPSHECLA